MNWWRRLRLRWTVSATLLQHYAFFNFAKPQDQQLFGPELPASPFRHIALNVDAETQQGIERRRKARPQRRKSSL